MVMDENKIKGLLSIINDEIKEASDLSVSEICHYTSIDALNGILKDSEFRFSNVHFMNDPHDGIFFVNMFLDYIEYHLVMSFNYSPHDLSKIKNGDAGKVLSGVNEIASKYHFRDFLFNYYCFLNWKYFTEARFRWFGSQVFSMSFSATEESQDLPQWRSYANNCSGVRINFNVKSLEEGIKKQNSWIQNIWEVKVLKVIYLNKENSRNIFERLFAEIKNFYDKFPDISARNLFFSLDSAILLFNNITKVDHYASESEYRLMFDTVVSGVPDINFNVTSDKYAKPYINVNFNTGSISSVVTGPALDDWHKTSIMMLCAKKIRQDIEVKSSQIRFRG